MANGDKDSISNLRAENSKTDKRKQSLYFPEQMLNEIFAEFSQQHHIDVELRLVAPMLLPELVHTAVISPQFDIPDIIIHPLEQTMGWAEAGILDVELTDDIINRGLHEYVDAFQIAVNDVGAAIAQTFFGAPVPSAESQEQ